MASGDDKAELAGAEGKLPGSLFHISQDCEKGNRSGSPVAALHPPHMSLKWFLILRSPAGLYFSHLISWD